MSISDANFLADLHIDECFIVAKKKLMLFMERKNYSPVALFERALFGTPIFLKECGQRVGIGCNQH